MTNRLRSVIAAVLIASMPLIAACGAKHVPTKAQWMQRYKEVMKGDIKAPRKEFVYALGEPTHSQPLGPHYIWIYRLADGQIQLKILKYQMRKRDEVFVDVLNEF